MRVSRSAHNVVQLEFVRLGRVCLARVERRGGRFSQREVEELLVYGKYPLWNDDPPQNYWPQDMRVALLEAHIITPEEFASNAAEEEKERQAAASSPEEESQAAAKESQAAKKSKSESERSSSIFPISRFSRVDSGSNASTAKLKDKSKKKIRFRWINEQLYTRMGYEALNMFEQDRTLFDVYHKGFSAQTSK